MPPTYNRSLYDERQLYRNPYGGYYSYSTILDDSSRIAEALIVVLAFSLWFYSLYRLYSAWQNIVEVETREGNPTTYDVVGPVCETGDFLGKDRTLTLAEGDLLAVMGSGAYSFAMSSNYNTRPRAPEILVSGGIAHVIREREQLEDLWASERLPEHLV